MDIRIVAKQSEASTIVASALRGLGLRSEIKTTKEDDQTTFHSKALMESEVDLIAAEIERAVQRHGFSSPLECGIELYYRW